MDGEPRGAPVNAHQFSWAAFPREQGSLNIQYFTLDRIGQGDIMYMNASVNVFTTSIVALWLLGAMWSPPVFGWVTIWSWQVFERWRIWAGIQSNLWNLLMVDDSALGKEGEIVPAGVQECGGGGCTIIVLEWLHCLAVVPMMFLTISRSMPGLVVEPWIGDPNCVLLLRRGGNTSSYMCVGICEGVSIVSSNETYCVDIR